MKTVLWITLIFFYGAATDAATAAAAFIRSSISSSSPSTVVGRRFSGSSSRSAQQEQIDTDYFTWLGRQVELKIRPKPYEGRRDRIEKDLAVLLMRSSYAVADELDFVAMDQFQKDFFHQRQAEWQDYVDCYPPLSIRQGELTDPAYFDFISCAQYLTVNHEMRNGKLVFVELINADGEKQVVKRDAAFEDNNSLPPEHARRVGDRIMAKFLESPDVYRPAVGNDLSYPMLIESVRRVMDLFTVQKFNQGNKVQVLDNNRFQVTSNAPANWWSLNMLKFRNEALFNDFEAKAICSLLRSCNYPKASYSMQLKDGNVVYTFKLA